MWVCPHCTTRSYNPIDVEAHYCGRCHHFCDDQTEPQVIVVVTRWDSGTKGLLTTHDLDQALAYAAQAIKIGATEVIWRLADPV